MGRVIYNLDELLLSLLGSQDLVDKWWNSDNTYFHGDTPEQVFRSNPQKVINYINQFCYGDYS